MGCILRWVIPEARDAAWLVEGLPAVPGALGSIPEPRKPERVNIT